MEQRQPLPDLMVLDGGLATELERRGYDVSGGLWSARALLDAPEMIGAVHEAYLTAGADCVTTATYQVSREGFLEAGLPADAAERAWRRAIEIADEARRRQVARTGRQAWVAASVGPYGAILHDGSEYTGRYQLPFDALAAFHRSRLEWMLDSPVDLLACETLPSLDEALAIVDAMTALPRLRGWISFTCADDSRTVHGERIADCAAALDAVDQVVAVGVNCTAPQFVSSLIAEIRRVSSKPIVVYPNSGEAWDAAAREWRGLADSADYATHVREWHAGGASWIGGCCRTGPEHIRQVRAIVKPSPQPAGSPV